YIELNAELARKWPTITKTRAALPDADDWAKVDDKKALLDKRGENDES
ncbi:MAG: DUF3470 domain-containing protein, partial [Burkholderiaceae bacterium]|nr:DUF3470 domain-containing protein [Burkholderiaceae bacterium]